MDANPQIIKVSSKRQITIPAKLYQSLGFSEHAWCVPIGGGIYLCPAHDGETTFDVAALEGVLDDAAALTGRDDAGVDRPAPRRAGVQAVFGESAPAPDGARGDAALAVAAVRKDAVFVPGHSGGDADHTAGVVREDATPALGGARGSVAPGVGAASAESAAAPDRAQGNAAFALDGARGDAVPVESEAPGNAVFAHGDQTGAAGHDAAPSRALQGAFEADGSAKRIPAADLSGVAAPAGKTAVPSLRQRRSRAGRSAGARPLLGLASEPAIRDDENVRSVVEAVCQASSEYPAVKKVFLFGDFARGDYDDDSAVDLRLELGAFGSFGLHDLMVYSRLIEQSTGRRANVVSAEVVVNQELAAAIERDKVLIFEQ